MSSVSQVRGIPTDQPKVNMQVQQSQLPRERVSSEQVAEPAAPDRQQISNEQISSEIKKLNNILEAAEKNIRFAYHEETRQLLVQVVNTETQEVIKTLPPEYLLDLSTRIKEMVGMFIDERI